MNNCLLIGNLTKDVELKQTNSGKSVANFTLAVARKFDRDTTDFINIVVWGAQAENCAKYLSKGSKAAVCGEMQTRTYEAQDGSKRYITEIVANEVEFLGGVK